MKITFIFFLFSLGLTTAYASPAPDDVTPENTHPLERCVRVVNPDKFPGVVLIGYFTKSNNGAPEAYQVKPNTCLTKGYKFNSLNLYWMKKEDFDPVRLPYLGPSDMTLLLEHIEPYGGYINAFDPLVREDIEYSIAGFSGKKLIFYRSGKTSRYNDGSQKVERFTNNIATSAVPPQTTASAPGEKAAAAPSLAPVKKGYWRSMACFFRGLLGGTCR